MTNPYETPNSELQNSAKTISVYSPVQAACGTIGGPVGLIYFLRANFVALGNKSAATKTVIFGSIFILAIIISFPFLPDNFSGLPFTIAYIVIAKQVAEKFQLSKQAITESTIYKFHSNWRVVGMGIICLIGSILVLIIPVLLLGFLGIIQI